MSMRLFLIHIVFPIVVGIVIFVPIFCCTWFLWLMVGFSQPLMDPRFVTILVHLIIPAGMLAVWLGIMFYIFGTSGEGTTSFSRFVHVLYLGIIGIVVAVLVQFLGYIVDEVLLFVFQQRLSLAILGGICTIAKLLAWVYSMCKLSVFTNLERQG